MNVIRGPTSYSSTILITIQNNIMHIKTFFKNGQKILSSFGCYFDYSPLMELFGNLHKKKSRRKR